MVNRGTGVHRRRFLATGAGLIAVAVGGRRVEAAEMTAGERANVEVVNNFCAAWQGHDVSKIMSFFDDTVVYRASQTAEPTKGREAVAARVKGFIDRVDRFEVLETFARGPMVVNERIDWFSSGALKSWRGVGVFLLKDGKIVEWYDYTISTDRAQV